MYSNSAYILEAGFSPPPMMLLAWQNVVKASLLKHFSFLKSFLTFLNSLFHKHWPGFVPGISSELPNPNAEPPPDLLAAWFVAE